MIELMYRSFGQQPPPDLTGRRRAVVWLLALCFVVSSVLMLAVFNFFALFVGVFVNFLGRDGVRFHFLHLFRRIPVIGFAPLTMTIYAVYRNSLMVGYRETLMMPVLTIAGAALLIAIAVGLNTLIGRGR